MLYFQKLKYKINKLRDRLSEFLIFKFYHRFIKLVQCFLHCFKLNFAHSFENVKNLQR